MIFLLSQIFSIACFIVCYFWIFRILKINTAISKFILTAVWGFYSNQLYYALINY